MNQQFVIYNPDTQKYYGTYRLERFWSREITEANKYDTRDAAERDVTDVYRNRDDDAVSLFDIDDVRFIEIRTIYTKP